MRGDVFRRPRLPEIGDLGQFQGRRQEQAEERRFRYRREARRGSRASMAKRCAASMPRCRSAAGAVKAFTLNGKIGRDTPVAADLRGGRAQGNREG